MKKIIAIFVLLAIRVFAGGPYYVSFNSGSDANNGTSSATPWKLIAGMPGFAGSGYSHVAGETWYVKLGDTWTAAAFPWVIANSGSAGNIDTYTTLPGFGTGSQPTLDAQGTNPAGGMIQSSGKSFFTLNNLNVINCGTTLVSTAGKAALDFNAGNNITVSNCTLAVEKELSIYIHFDAGAATTYSNFTISNNVVSHCASLMWIGTSGANYAFDGLNIQGNHLFDGKSQIINGTHADGLVHWFSPSPHNDATQFADHILIEKNKVDGDWSAGDTGSGAGITAFAFSEQVTLNCIIRNNSFTVTSIAVGQVPIWLSTSSNTMTIESNTFDANGIDSGLGIDVYEGTSLTVKNNIMYGGRYAFDIETVSGAAAVDYNMWYSASGQVVYNGGFQSYATWQAAGRDTHGILGTAPTFVSPSSNLALNTGSAGIGAGVDLSGSFTTDINSVTRTVPWDMGAYKYGSAGPTNSSSLTGKILLSGKVQIK